MEPLDPGPLLDRARSEGFSAAGVCEAGPPRSIGAYREWIEAGRHGQMEYLSRHAELKADPARLLTGACSALAVALDYVQDPLPPDRVRIARYALGRDYHKVLRGKLRRIAGWLAETYPGIRTRICVDSAPILEREFAHRAGLGWFGKNTMLIDSRRGSWFFLGILLLDRPFRPSSPSLGACGTCRRCVDACPTGAIVHAQGRWQVDARSCISYLTIEHRGPIEPHLARKIGDWTFGCDVCQEVCPFNQPRATQPERARPTAEPDLVRRRWPMPAEAALMTQEEWDSLTRGTAVRRAGFEGWARNVRINRANRERGLADLPTTG